MRRMALVFVLNAVLLAGVSWAVPVDPAATSGIAAQDVEIFSDVPVRGILCTNGSIYTCEVSGAGAPGIWRQRPAPLPVPIGDIADWTQSAIITHGGEVWVWTIIMGVGDGWQWHRWDSIPAMPPAPCGSVAVEPSSHGRVKALFR